MNETHVPYYDFRDWEVTQNDQVFQQAIATARHLEVRRRRLAGANENILFDLLSVTNWHFSRSFRLIFLNTILQI